MLIAILIVACAGLLGVSRLLRSVSDAQKSIDGLRVQVSDLRTQLGQSADRELVRIIREQSERIIAYGDAGMDAALSSIDDWREHKRDMKTDEPPAPRHAPRPYDGTLTPVPGPVASVTAYSDTVG